MWPAYLSLVWACQGFSGGAAVGGSRVFGDEHSSLLLPGFPEGGLQSDDVTRWQYVTPDNLIHNRIVPPAHVVRTVNSSISVLGLPAKSRESLLWRYLSSKTENEIVYYSLGVVRFNSYYQYRAEFLPLTGGLLLRHLQVEDSGIYEVILNPFANNKLMKGDQIAYLQLDVQEQLLAPLIVQDPAYIVDRVELNCFVKNGKPSAILWQKENEPILKSSYYRLEFDNTTLFIKDMKASHCGLYTCTVKNGVSTSSNSHFLTTNGFPIGYRIGTGFGCLQGLAVMVYAVILFLQRTAEQSPSFLSTNWKRSIFLGCGAFAVLIAALPIHKAKQNLQNCRFPHHGLVVNIILSATLYVCGLGTFVLFLIKFNSLALILNCGRDGGGRDYTYRRLTLLKICLRLIILSRKAQYPFLPSLLQELS